MHIFSKHCFCRSRLIPFRSEANLDEHAVANVFCPHCSDRAPAEGFMVAVTGIPGWSGIYAIDWNQQYLRESDMRFKDTERYYRKLFSSGALAFGFLPQKFVERAYDILGVKEHLPSEVFVSGETGKE